jgi:osmotically-inducible protein OsmY
MRHRDEWGRPYRDDLERGPDRRRFEPDYGQADYSRDFAYDPDRRTGYRVADENLDRDDFGQADYSEDYAYDPAHRRGYRRSAADRDAYDRYEHEPREVEQDRWRDRSVDRPVERRSWMDRAGDGMSSWFGARRPRGASSDRVIWAVVTQRLANARGLDDSDIEVLVDRGEVILNGTVRDREDKRRAEDLAELRGVPHVQNNLRVRRRGLF